MFKYCPSCASQNIKFEKNKVFRCPDCGFTYYHNIAAASGCVITVPAGDGSGQGGGDRNSGGRIMFLVRGKEPARGKLDLPGGFVDLGEGALDGLIRELREEIGWTPSIPQGESAEKHIKLFASFPNVYPYKNIVYNTCDLFFTCSAPGLKEQDLKLQESEIAGVRFLKISEINYDDFAFDSTRRAIRAFVDYFEFSYYV
jgi:ADP-ribose pyrophosphatase YjhB (NUDIX family)